MPRLKRLQFWGRDVDDDDLLLQALDGQKTATADLARDWHVLRDGTTVLPATQRNAS